MSKPIGIALLGLGRAGTFHRSSLRQSENATLISVFDADRDTTLQVAENEGCTAAQSAEAAICDPAVGAVIVATPTDTHYDYVIHALTAGKAVFSEKPLGQNLAELDELEAKLAEGTQASVELYKFEVVRSRFFHEEQQYIGSSPIIELTVRNGTDQPVFRAYFEGVVASPERAVPWITEIFSKQIAGGLESGEEASWRLSPNSYSWGTVDVPDDAILTVTTFAPHRSATKSMPFRQAW